MKKKLNVLRINLTIVAKIRLTDADYDLPTTHNISFSEGLVTLPIAFRGNASTIFRRLGIL